MGGGGSKTTNKTNIKTQAIVDAMAQSIMNCKNNQVLVQRFEVSGNYNTISNFKMVQNFNLSTSCSNNAQVTQDIQNAVASAIKQQLSSQSESVLGAIGNGSVSEANTNIDNEVKTTLTAQTITNVITDTMAQQEAIISGDHNIINNFEMSETMNILQNNCQKVISDMKSVQDIKNEEDTKLKSTQTNPLAAILDSIFKGLTNLSSVYAIILIVALVVGGYIIIKGGFLNVIFDVFKDKSSTQYNQPTSTQYNQPTSTQLYNQPTSTQLYSQPNQQQV